MGDVYLRGAPIALVYRFFSVDPVTGDSALDDPDTVTFTVETPDSVSTAYVYGTDPNVTHPSIGLYVCSLDPQLPPGTYVFRVVGTGHVQAVTEGTFDVIESAVLAPDPASVPVVGPCSSWITGSDVAAYDSSLGVGTATWDLDDVAYMASHLLYELSGRQFPGVCQQTVRPCRQGCGCFGMSPSLGLGPWSWTYASFGIGGWGWANECGDSCGCGSESYVKLSGYPVREILEVKIDGAAIDPSEYRLDKRRMLIRMADASTSPPTPRAWPVCQDLSLPDTEPGTYSVTYTWGADVPALGRAAAAQLAAELWRAMPSNQGECRLPTKVTKIARQGISMERVVSVADMLRSGSTGLQLVDAFIALVNPQKAHRRSAVYSPDLPFARRVGQ